MAQPRAVKNVLREAYHDPETVTDELVDCILKPGLQPGAAQVFLDFISYSGGPLPEDLLPQLSRERCPVLIAWGEKDPWEPMNEGRKLYGSQPCVEEFVVLPNVGRAPPPSVLRALASLRSLRLTVHGLSPSPRRSDERPARDATPDDAQALPHGRETGPREPDLDQLRQEALGGKVGGEKNCQLSSD